MLLPASLHRLAGLALLHPDRWLLGVGGVLVLALLCTYGLVIATSVRQADLAKAAALSLSNARMACETLPLARARSSCTEAATRVERDRNSIESAFAH